MFLLENAVRKWNVLNVLNRDVENKNLQFILHTYTYLKEVGSRFKRTIKYNRYNNNGSLKKSRRSIGALYYKRTIHSKRGRHKRKLGDQEDISPKTRKSHRTTSKGTTSTAVYN